MLYRVVKVLMGIALRVFYRKIYVKGLENVPATGPVILLSNHPSSLMDAAIIGLLVKRPVHFFTRGDVFVNKGINYVLARLNMIPVYTHEGEGGRSTIGFNEASYIRAEKILTEGGLLLFFPEGNSRPGHQLMPLRKGVFRMALQAAEKNDFRYDISFVPAGISYEHPVKSDQAVLVSFGKPFLLSAYQEEYRLNPRGTLLHLAKDGFSAMEKNVLHIQDNADHQLAEECLTIVRNQPAVREASSETRFEQEKKICDDLNSMDSVSRNALEAGINNYFEALKKYGLEDRTVLPDFSFSAAKKGALLLGLPLYATGCLLNALPVCIGKWIADTRVYRQDFYSWIFVTTSLALYIFWLTALFALALAALGWPAATGIVLTTLITGYFALHYRHWVREYVQYRRLKRLSFQSLADLRDKRSRLLVAG